MYYAIGVSVPSLHRESTGSLISISHHLHLYSDLSGGRVTDVEVDL